LEFQTFDAEYVRRLTAGDPETEAHFSAYFGKFVSLKLRSRYVASGVAEDVRQETLYRVLKTLRQGNGVAQPERFGSFVNSVCNNVLLEQNYKAAREAPGEQESPDIADQRIDIDGSLITAERKRLVEAVLQDLEAKDREILRLVFFENAGRKDICRELNVQPGYLRVLLHRAKGKFQAAYVRKKGASMHFLLLCL
jgi:RNA polymerase sigma-70 factor (ECF subfamily)